MTLYLLPNVLSETKDALTFLPQCLPTVMASIDGIIAESQKGALRYLKKFRLKKRPHEMPFAILDKRTPKEDYSFLAEPLLEGQTWGLISDAGLPMIADPGASFIFYLQTKGVRVDALPGPSSLFMALMLSGLPSQTFTFHGYPPRSLTSWAKKIEKNSQDTKSCELFIEAPQRNQATYDQLIEALEPKTFLSIHKDLLGPLAFSKTQTVRQWKQGTWQWAKVPTFFILSSAWFLKN